MASERDREMSEEWSHLTHFTDKDRQDLAESFALRYAEGVKAERAAVLAWLDANTEWYRADAAIRNGEHVPPREAEEGKGT